MILESDARLLQLRHRTRFGGGNQTMVCCAGALAHEPQCRCALELVCTALELVCTALELVCTGPWSKLAVNGGTC
jgi:hypothetical protein